MFSQCADCRKKKHAQPLCSRSERKKTGENVLKYHRIIIDIRRNISGNNAKYYKRVKLSMQIVLCLKKKTIDTFIIILLYNN